MVFRFIADMKHNCAQQRALLSDTTEYAESHNGFTLPGLGCQSETLCFFHRLSSTMTMTYLHLHSIGCCGRDAELAASFHSQTNFSNHHSYREISLQKRCRAALRVPDSHSNRSIRQPIYFPMPTPLLHTCSHRAATPSLATGTSNSQTPHRCRPS